jgi:DNA-binding response OmpR family regulator
MQQSILCVDDDEESRALLCELLREHHPKFAGNAFEGVRELHNGVYDAYVLDQWLPDWTGVQLCRVIRKIDPHGPVLFYTAAAQSQDRDQAMRAGASAYLTKPVDPQRLRCELRVLLELAALESINARVEAERATRDEVARYHAQALIRGGPVKQSIARTMERAARLKAAYAFISSGGTRANFERWWPSLFAAALAHYGVLENLRIFW